MELDLMLANDPKPARFNAFYESCKTKLERVLKDRAVFCGY
jgi:hypothetical protein